MITIIGPDQFTVTPWKNGQGKTTEMAINEGGSLSGFDWRISQAQVVENGLFSDFTGYQRHLVLLRGHGITLTHDEAEVDELTTPLAVAVFDGACQTYGRLIDGQIEDLNVIFDQDKYSAQTRTYEQAASIICQKGQLHLVYATDSNLIIQCHEDSFQLSPQHLLQISVENIADVMINGHGFVHTALQNRK